MEIKKRLITQGATEVNAVLLYDEGEEYPVFLNSLHNTIIFPTLMESGYKLTDLPYGFEKDGVSFNSLPIEHIVVNDVQHENMYNSIGVMMSYEEIKKHISVTDTTGIKMPEANYTIRTREELLNYLNATALATDENDFLPLNYFVAPEARFTLDEYINLENHHYIELINKRRKMTLRKFKNLCTWLKNYGISYSSNPLDVIDAYFAWGIDGLNTTILSKRRESRPFKLDVNPVKKVPFRRFTIGLADGAGNQLTPKNERDVVWRLIMKEDEFREHISGLRFDDTKVTRYMAAAKQDITILECVSNVNIMYSTDTLIMNGYSYPTLEVQSPVSNNVNLDLNLAMPGNYDKLREHCLIDSMAKLIYNTRKPRVRVSSYDVLLACGCNPNKALNYIAVDQKLNKEPMARRTSDEMELPYIDDRVIESYLTNPNSVSEDESSCIEDMINGLISIDKIGNGKDADSMFNIETYYNQIYAIHNVFEISLEDIYEKIKSITPDMKYLEFTDGSGVFHRINVAPLTGATMGYLNDFKNYNLQRGQESSYFTYVTMVAREVGSEKADRHVALEFYLVNKSKPEVSDIIQKLTAMYEEKVMYTVPNEAKQRNLMRAAMNWAYNAYFEIVFKGTITYPNALGSTSIPADSEMRRIATKYLERKIEMLTAYCDSMAVTFDYRSLSFNGFCVNAYITPTFVVPKKNRIIKEVPFYSAWCDWERTNPEMYARLVEAGVLPQGWKPWCNRYIEEQFYKRSLEELDNDDSLLHYYDRAVEEVRNYPNDLEFTSVKHPIEYMYPGLYNSDDTEVKLDVPRQGEPVIRLGASRELKYEDFEYKLFPTELNVEDNQYIRIFNGFTTDELFNVTNPFDKIPFGNSTLVVLPESRTIYVSDTEQTMDYRRITELDLNKYPIVHLYDRRYLLLASNGEVWEVRI